MKIKYNYWFVVLILFFILLIFSFMYYENEINETIDYENIQKYNIQTDGIQILYDQNGAIGPLTQLNQNGSIGHLVQLNSGFIRTTEITDDKLKQDALSILPSDYIFLDYIYNISGNSLSTFHRDVTSSSKIYNTEYPVYTMIIYKTDGELLSFCPNSHTSYPFVWSNIVNITGKGGTAFVFDSELLHAGSIDNCENRKAVQYKICHKNDVSKLSHLNGVNAKKESVCTVSPLTKWIYHIFRKMSYYFELPINTGFYPIMIEKQDGIIGWVQDIIPIKYYNNI